VCVGLRAADVEVVLLLGGSLLVGDAAGDG